MKKKSTIEQVENRTANNFATVHNHIDILRKNVEALANDLPAAINRCIETAHFHNKLEELVTNACNKPITSESITSEYDRAMGEVIELRAKLKNLQWDNDALAKRNNNQRKRLQAVFAYVHELEKGNHPPYHITTDVITRLNNIMHAEY